MDNKFAEKPLTEFPRLRLLLHFLLVVVLWATTRGALAVDHLLAREARPILSEYCFACHGPDEAKRKEGLRLDTQEGIEASGVLKPDDSGESPLLQRLFSHDPNFVMPPPEAHRKPTDADLQILKRWIEAGAPYESHWAFQPILEIAPPQVEDNTGWAETPIDAFVLQKLNEKGLKPSPTTAKETLIRRLSLDLTGLPPTLDEVDAFLNDQEPGAYERLIDRLLASPTYGERMANDWMDLARYADTFGYQNDVENQVWPWRDWLIRSFNQNQPYDEFLTWQLAGDLLPGATQDPILATAFNRLHRQTNEGGSTLEEFRVEYVADRTRTFGTVFLGMTFECARCHDHKFDPISQEDYYQIFAFFNNIDESGMYSHFTNATPSPSQFLYSEGQREQHQDLKDAIIRSEKDAEATAQLARTRFEEWLENEYRPIPSRNPVAYLPLDAIHDSTTEDKVNPGYSATLAIEPSLTEGMKGNALRFSGDNSVQIKHAGAFERTDAFSFAMWLKMEKPESRQVVFHRSMAAEDAGSRGYELWIEEGKPVFSLVHFWPGNALRVKSTQALDPERWVHLAVTYEGSSRADGIHLYLDGAEVPLETVRDHLFETIRYGGGGSDPALTLGARFRDSGFKNGRIDEFKVFDRELSALEIEAEANWRNLPRVVEDRADSAKGSEVFDSGLFDYFLSAVDPPYEDSLDRMRIAREAENTFSGNLLEIMVMRELPEVRPAYVLKRGAYDNRGDEVQADTPASIFPFPSDIQRNRLGLAKWLVDPANPLTSRVAVNRVWALFFGKGLVRTPEDFGNQGSPPTHPELLDYLAWQFMESGWDMKALCKRIALSATYRQDSTPRQDLNALDPTNEWLARGPNQRLSAEQIRDSALAASGLLVEKIGGPSVKPYQPEGIWRDSSQVDYTQDHGEGLYRRSMYTFLKRTVPPPSMVTFDATNREVCVARREVTATPLQSLVILNDPQFVEAARVLAEKTARRESDAKAKIEALFRTLTCRWPDTEEQAILQAAFDEQKAYFEAHPEEARAYVQVGETTIEGNIEVVDLAALTAVAQLSMNFEEFQVKQ